MREPKDGERSAARFIVRHIASIDDEDKRVRFMSNVIRDYNVQVEEQQAIIAKIYDTHYFRKLKRAKEQRRRARELV